ncbi:hypothetical protein BpHYR1_023586, partial [Brachionus plicatilis]
CSPLKSCKSFISKNTSSSFFTQFFYSLLQININSFRIIINLIIRISIPSDDLLENKFIINPCCQNNGGQENKVYFVIPKLLNSELNYIGH